jgi:hypothetical protein
MSISEIAYDQEQENLSGADDCEAYMEHQRLTLNRFSLIKREIEKELKLLEALKNDNREV